MRAYHKSCGSSNLAVTHSRDQKSMSFCHHCKRHIENEEIAHTDRRISAVTFKGKAYIFGRECS
jgi:hypothetical protein